jgi:hypothetical protein
MKHRHITLILCTFPVALACNADGKDDGGVDPLPCTYVDQTIEDGEEVEALDGCSTLVCDNGSLLTGEDRRATIAGDLELSSQELVDAQSCLGVVEGTVRISGTAADLTPLYSLYHIGGGLEITASEAATLEGLEGLTEVGGAIVIADNAALTRMSFLPYMSAFGDVTIQNNDVLASLAGAEFIGQCTSCIGISGKPTELTEDLDPALEPAGDGFAEPQGGTFYGNILIADNDVLTDVLAMGNLYYAWSNVVFRGNAALTSLTGLSLMEVRGNLEISGHASMPTADVDAFVLNISVLGTTTICGNQGGTACP